MSKQPDPKSLFAAYLVRAGIIKDLATINVDNFKGLEPSFVDTSQPPKDGLYPEVPHDEKDYPGFENAKVCIVGAGISGLYSAYIFDQLGINYDVLESSNRVGGRILTHYFSEETSDNYKEHRHDYYDIGAMRFPKSPVMDRTFKLFKTTGVELRPYEMEHELQPTRFNDRTVFGYDPNAEYNANNAADKKRGLDPFEVGIEKGGTVPTETLKNPGGLLDDAYDLYRRKIKDTKNSAKGFQYLINHDKFSLRDYLSFVESHNDETIHWLETLNSATGWFGQAFTENVLETLAFDYAKGINWYCVEGGTEQVVKRLVKKLRHQPELESPVVRIARDDKLPDHEQMLVTFRKDQRLQTRKYAAVINTTTFGALQKMNLIDLKLPYAFKTAIRSLHYDTSSKVGIKFTHNWWRKEKQIDTGGLGKTDMPIRVCVYPSYNAGDPEDMTAVLLASYTWGQDSERVASFITQNSPEGEDDLKELMIYNLARLHSDSQAEFERMEKIIRDAWITHHAFDWSKDRDAAGAFALFSAGDFTKLYNTLVRPACDSRFYIVGEAASAHHAWIVGALDSSVRALYLLLTRFQQYGKRQQLLEKFGQTGELDYDTAYLQVAMGMLAQKQQPNTSIEPFDLAAPVLNGV